MREFRRQTNALGVFSWSGELVLRWIASLQLATVRCLVLATCNQPALESLQKPIISQYSRWHCACDAIKTHESIFRSNRMADVIFIIVTVVFFIIACLYVRGCDRL
jgi:hypothetical protein